MSNSKSFKSSNSAENRFFVIIITKIPQMLMNLILTLRVLKLIVQK
jgi:hypothetical protein